MGTYDQHPGGGYQAEKGYTPPAGSQADKQSQRDEFAASQSQQRAMNDAFAAASSSSGWSGGSSTSSGSAGSRRQSTARATNTKQAAAPRPNQRRAKPAAPPRPQRHWNPLVGTIAFVAVTVIVASRMTGDNKWILAAATGLAAGAIIGRLWKQMLVVTLLAGAAWLYFRTPSGVTRTTDSSFLTPAPTLAPTPPPVFLPTPPPVAPLPDYVPHTTIHQAPPVVTTPPAASTPPPQASAPIPVAPPLLTLFGPSGRTTGSVSAQLLHGHGMIEFFLDAPCNLHDIDRLEFQSSTALVSAVLTTGERLPLGLDVPSIERPYWAAASNAYFYQAGAVNVMAVIPLRQVP